MKIREWFKSKSTQELLMILVISMLVIMIATRWGYISRTAGSALKHRFIPPEEQADSAAQSSITGQADSAAQSSITE